MNALQIKRCTRCEVDLALVLDKGAYKDQVEFREHRGDDSAQCETCGHEHRDGHNHNHTCDQSFHREEQHQPGGHTSKCAVSLCPTAHTCSCALLDYYGSRRLLCAARAIACSMFLQIGGSTKLDGA